MIKTNPVQVMLSVMVTFGFFFCLYYMLKLPIPTANKEVLYTMLGSLGTVWVLVMNYFFGSTSSSKAKDQTISDIATAAPIIPAPVNIPNAESVSVQTTKGNVTVGTRKRRRS